MKRLLNINDIVDYLSISKPTARKFCSEIGAEVRIGARILYDKNVIDSYIDQQTVTKEN